MLMPCSSMCLPVGGDAHQLTLLRARRREPFDHDVVLGDEGVQLAVPVGKGGAEHGAGHRACLPRPA